MFSFLIYCFQLCLCCTVVWCMTLKFPVHPGGLGVQQKKNPFVIFSTSFLCPSIHLPVQKHSSAMSGVQAAVNTKQQPCSLHQDLQCQDPARRKKQRESQTERQRERESRKMKNNYIHWVMRALWLQGRDRDTGVSPGWAAGPLGIFSKPHSQTSHCTVKQHLMKCCRSSSGYRQSCTQGEQNTAVFGRHTVYSVQYIVLFFGPVMHTCVFYMTRENMCI